MDLKKLDDDNLEVKETIVGTFTREDLLNKKQYHEDKLQEVSQMLSVLNSSEPKDI